MTTLPTVFITGASSGIGATYAERFARCGHDLVLVARNKSRLDALAMRLREQHQIAVEVLQADLTNSAELPALETRLRHDARIGILINNAGMLQSGHFLEQSPEAIESQIALNITALTRLAAAIAPRLAQSGTGQKGRQEIKYRLDKPQMSNSKNERYEQKQLHPDGKIP